MAEADILVSESLKTSALFNKSNPLIADQAGNPPEAYNYYNAYAWRHAASFRS
jgi:hypothetical protein